MTYLNCPNCGEEIKSPNQRFCEECGSELLPSASNVEAKPARVAMPPPTTGRMLGLFDVNRNYYILKEKYWDWGSGDILDEKNQVIGKMHRVFFSARKRIELKEVDGTVSATIHSKIVSARGAQDLKDPQGNLIARIKKKILTFFRPIFFLEDPQGNRWYEAHGNFMGWSYKIQDLSTGNIVGEIEKADKWRDVFLRGLFDFQDTYALRILDNVTDRRILVGFVLSIDNVLFDRQYGGPGIFIWGIPRRRGGLPGRVPRRIPGRFPGGGLPRRLPGGFPRR